MIEIVYTYTSVMKKHSAKKHWNILTLLYRNKVA